MKQRVRLLVFGCMGGILGSLIAETIEPKTEDEATATMMVISCAVWFGIIATLIAIFLRWSIALNCAHRFPTPRQIATSTVIGFVAGAIGGALAQSAYMLFEDGFVKRVVVRILCWGVSGGFLGILLSQGVPNLRPWRGGIFGILGGIAGWAVLVGIFELAEGDSVLARVLAFATTGSILGLSIAIADAVEARRGAYIEVNYSPKESVRITLGATPITFGGTASDTVYMKGFGSGSLVISLKAGKVFARQSGTNDIALGAKSLISIGTTTIRIHC